MNYEHISQKLSESTSEEIRITFSEFDNLVGCLPEESKYRKWWDNSGETPQSKAWCSAGYSVSKVIPDAYVQFVRNEKDCNSMIAPSTIGISNLESMKKEMDSYWTPGEKENNNNSLKTIKNPDFETVKKEMDSYWTPSGNKTMNNSSVSSEKKMNSTGKKEDPSKACVTLGIILLILDFAIGIPALIHYISEFEMESFLGILIVGVIFFIIGIICIASGSPGSFGGLPSGNYYKNNDSLYIMK